MANELNYVNYDFDDLVTQLQNRLKEQSTWKDTYRSSTGQMLIELFAAVGNLILYSIERRAEESYLGTAKNRSSIINLTRLVGYSFKRRVSASGTLRFTITPTTKIVFIPKYTSCSTAGNIKYVTTEDATIVPGQSYVDVSAIQGEAVILSYTSTGLANQEYKIEDTTAENTHLEIAVDGATWTLVDSFIDSVSTSTHYIERNELDDTVTVLFGNDVFGKSPAVSTVISINYIKSLGISGGVYSTGLITTLNSTIYNEDSTAVSTTVTNTTNFVGGADIETTEEIRYNAPKVFVAGARAVIKDDYSAILNDYPGVADSNVWGESEEDPPNIDMYNRVKISLLLEDWQYATTVFKNDLTEYLYDTAQLTVRYTFVDPDIIQVYPVLTVKVARGYSLSEIQTAITDVLEAEFALGTTTRIGLAKRYADISAKIKAVPGVSYHYLNLSIYQILTSTFSSTYEWTGNLYALPILPGSVDIYLNDVLVGSDNGTNGTIVDATTNYALTGTVNYTTGVVHLDFIPSVGVGVVSVVYNQNENGDVVPGKNQICKYYDTDFVSVAYA